MATRQMDLFGEAKLAEPEPNTTMRLGKKAAQIPLRKQRRQASQRLMEILKELEGKDIYVDSYDAGGRHFWLDNLKLPRLRLDLYPMQFRDDHNYIPSEPKPTRGHAVVPFGSPGLSALVFYPAKGK